MLVVPGAGVGLRPTYRGLGLAATRDVGLTFLLEVGLRLGPNFKDEAGSSLARPPTRVAGARERERALRLVFGKKEGEMGGGGLLHGSILPEFE